MTIDDVQAIINQTLNYSEFTFDEDEEGFILGSTFVNPGPLGHIVSYPMRDLNIVDIFTDFGKALQSEIIHKASNDLTKAQARELVAAVGLTEHNLPTTCSWWMREDVHPKVIEGLRDQGLLEPEYSGRRTYEVTSWGRLVALELWERKQRKERAA